MVAKIHYRWDFIGLSTDTKPTPATSEKVVNGSTFYCSDNSKLYIWYKDQWYEKTVSGGGGGGTTNFNALENRPKYNGSLMTGDTDIPEVTTYTAGANITITAGEIAATDTTYSNFTGTDGTAAGSAGLVPAPATTDAGKFLKADGTWDTAGGGGITELTSADYNFSSSGGTYDGVAIWKLDTGVYKAANGVKVYTYKTSNQDSSAVYTNSDAIYYSIKPTVQGFDYAMVGFISQTDNEFVVVTSSTGQVSTYYDDMVKQTYSILRQKDIASSTGTSTSKVMSQNATTNAIKAIAISGAGAPTTSTTGTVGQLYEDTTNGDLYICADATNPYVWEEVGGGGGGSGITELTTSDYNYPTANPDSIALWTLGPGIYQLAENLSVRYNTTDSVDNLVQNDSFLILKTNGRIVIIRQIRSKGVPSFWVSNPGTGYKVTGETDLGGGSITPVQTTGTSTTDVMSQNATTSMVFADPANKTEVCIGNNATTSTTHTVNLGDYSSTNYQGCVALGAYSGGYGTFTSRGVVAINSTNTDYGYGGNSNYRLLTGLYDGQSAHDAATVGQITPTTDSSAPTTSTAGRLGEVRIDTTDNSAYMCVAADTITPSYTWKQITA